MTEHSGRILVVDDEIDWQRMLASHLRRKGYDVETCGDGASALDHFSKNGEFDVVVADLMMPGMSGLDLIEQARERYPDLVFVVISGAGTIESAINSMRQGGAYDYLTKPLETLEDLSIAVRRAVEHRRLRRERERLQAQVRRERERLQAVIEHARDALLAVESDGSISVANPAAEELFGDELVGSPVEQKLPTPLAAMIDDWRTLAGGNPIVSEIHWPSDSVHMASLGPYPAESGEESGGLLLLLRNVTRFRQLQRMKMRLMTRAALEARGPLMDAFATLIDLNERPEASNEAMTSLLERQMQKLSRIRTWTDDLLRFTELESDPRPGQDGASIAVLLNDVPGALEQTLLDDKHLTVEINVPDGLEYEVARDPFLDLVGTLVHAAAWRIQPGEVIELKASSRDHGVWVEVIDRAPPLVDDQRARLFEDFVDAAAERLEGIGLNLAMARSLVESLNGQLWIQSQKGAGNRAIISLA